MAYMEEKLGTKPPAGTPTFTIARHAAQAMLHHALGSQPEICCGLLYGSSNETERAIHRTVPIANSAERPEQACQFDPQATSRALLSDKGEELEMLGLYRSFPDSGTTTAEMLSDIPAPLQDVQTTHLLYAAISLCTEGRLEIHAFSTHAGVWREQTLFMLEDGALYHMRHSG